MAYQCRLCLPLVNTFATDGNMRSHLGATGLAGHNMGPWRCLHPGCNRRSVRNAANANHGNHIAVWFNDPALVALRNAEAARCRLTWAPAPVAPPPAAAAAAVVQTPVVAPPVVAHGPPGAAPGLAATAPLAGAVQGPPVVAQVPTIAAPAAQVPPPASVVQAPAQVTATAASPAAQFPPPTDYFGPTMDDFEDRYAGKTREDIEKQYEEEQELYYQ